MLPTAKAEQLKVSLSDQAVLDNIRLAVAKNQHQRSTQPANNFTYKVAKGESVASIAKNSIRQVKR